MLAWDRMFGWDRGKDRLGFVLTIGNDIGCV